jgi:hypothetical protein
MGKSLLDKILDTAADVAGVATKYAPLVKTGISALSTYAAYKDQKAKNELQQAAYDDYMQAAAAAGKEAEAAIALNLTPMTISGVPTTKAEVTDYTAATGLKHGGISSLRKRYARGPGEFEVEQMDEEEVITPDYLMKEEGVNIGPQVFYNTGRGDRANALMIWDQMSTPDKSIFDFDFEIFFQDGGWRDMIKGEAPMSQGETQMASAPSMGDSQNEAAMQLFNKPYDQLNEMELQMFQEEMSKYMATGGIAGLRNGGRPGYNIGTLVEEEYVDTGDTTTGIMRDPQEMDLDRFYELKVRPIEDKLHYIQSLSPGAQEALKDEVEALKLELNNLYAPSPEYKYYAGGVAGLRKKYAYGPDVEDVEMMDEEFVGDNELKMEEGVQIGPMAGGGERGWKAQMRAMEIAEDEYGKDFYDLNDALQHKIYNRALQEIDDMFFDMSRKDTPQGIMMAAKGGRMGYAMGPGPAMDPRGLRSLPAMATKDGMMDLGGMEKDYRFSGGFVPIGEYEKKDDVPARLSKNEFVFTADAVRAAGGGSINKGAKRMYDTMKHLEAQPTAKRMTA